MPVRFRGSALATATGSDALTLPLPLGKRGIAVLVAIRQLVVQIFLGPNRQSIYNGLDTWNSARDDYCLL